MVSREEAIGLRFSFELSMTVETQIFLKADPPPYLIWFGPGKNSEHQHCLSN